MPFDWAYISNLHRKWPCRVPTDIPIQWQPLPQLHLHTLTPFLVADPFTIHSTWIGLKTCPILIYRSCFEAWLSQYFWYSMMMLGYTMSPERVDILKIRKESKISHLLVCIVSMLLLFLIVAGQLFESDSILLQTWKEILKTHSFDWLHSPPYW